MQRVWAAMLVGMLLVAALLWLMPLRRRATERPEAEVEAERRGRATSLVEVAPAPLPSSLPMIGEEGADADGYPLRTVDRPALRSLLWHERYQDLTSYVETLQDEFESDWRRELWPTDAAGALGTGEQDLLPRLDAWVKATPGSFAPYLARGTHWVNAGFQRRGGAWASKTADSDFAAMEEAFARASKDLDHALALRPRLVTALRQKLIAAMARSDRRQMTAIMQDAARACPHCLQVRVTYVQALRPRWRGTYDEMEAFARRERDAENPKTRFLAGYADLDKADLLRRDEKYDEALAALERACALGDYWAFLGGRAWIRIAQRDPERALADLDRALELRPGLPELLFEKARAHVQARRWEDAGRSLLDGLRAEPSDSVARSIFDDVVKGLVYEGWRLDSQGQREAALRVYDLAAQLAPGNAEVQARRATVVSRPLPEQAGEGDEVAQLEARVRAEPDDFRARQQLDYALARRGEYDRVVELWNGFLSRNPGHGQAFLERGGAHLHAGNRELALADARSACELGVNEGCLRARQLSPETSPP